MILETNLQVVPLQELEQGHTFVIVVTNAQSAVTLQFRHAGDPTYRDHPDFTAVAPIGTVVTRAVMCCTPDMRLSFASAPVSTCYISAIASASATF
jgi:hypothetical protein